MFEKYTEKARRAIFFARYEASQFGSPTIKTEHLLLGVLRADRILVNRLLRSPDSVEEIRKEIERSTPVREKVSTSVDLPVSNEGKRVLAYTAEEAERLGHKHIDTCHMLLGLLREEKSFAAKLLNDQKVYLSQVREQIHELESARETASTSGTPALRTPISISEFGVDLTQEAAEGKLPPLVGRESELERVIQVLCRLTRNSVLMAGEAGVGKQAIVYGLAQGISQGAISRLNGKTIVSLDLDFIGSAAKNRARFQTGLENILLELLRGGGPILF
ncbi:MAG TPA: Clp protease N-terminal domain-containing protein, partial [Candidatus Angelobacter sp.]|nr:Clp protease N-terminal domain-containing protein [Candidatus Angelobacter sp.]